jgi:hypothetical protein
VKLTIRIFGPDRHAEGEAIGFADSFVEVIPLAAERLQPGEHVKVFDEDGVELLQLYPEPQDAKVYAH